MRAKTINEISKTRNSGLDALGIGKAAMFKAYTYFKQNKPNSISTTTVEDFLKENESVIDDEKVDRFLERPYSNYVQIIGLSDEFMGNYLENLDGKPSTAYISINDDVCYVHSFYDRIYKAGFFHLVKQENSSSPVDSRYFYFVKYN